MERKKGERFMSKSKAAARATNKSVSQRIRAYWQLYLMLLIPVVLTVIYKYIPMYGIQIAFRNYKANRGYLGSEWVGLQWFERFFKSPNCVRMIRNTILLSFYSLLWSFPVPIILALLINQLRFNKFKRTVQTVLYAPHFISTMVVCGMIRIFLSPSGGLINLIAGTNIDFLSQSAAFRTIYIVSGIWQAGASSSTWRRWQTSTLLIMRRQESTALPCFRGSVSLTFRSCFRRSC